MTRQTDAPRHIVSTSTEATSVLRRLTRAGWTIREGFALPEPAWDLTANRLVLYGRVRDLDAVQLAVLAAARGAGVVAITDPTTPPGQALLDDLQRLGPVSRGMDRTDSDPVAALIPEQRALLDRLANGQTIAAAAAAEYLSLRTANRRIAEARALFGVRTTREAVLAYLRQRAPD